MKAIIITCLGFLAASGVSLWFLSDATHRLEHAQPHTRQSGRDVLPHSKQTNLDLDSISNLFGADPNLPDPTPREPKSIDLPIKLVGTISTGRSPSDQHGVATIFFNETNKIKPHLVRSEILPKVFLIRVYRNHVLIDNHGTVQSLRLVERVSQKRRSRTHTNSLPEKKTATSEQDPYREVEVTGNNVKITRNQLQSLTGDQLQKTLRGALVTPEFDDSGNVIGLRFTKVLPNSIFDKIGIQNNDLLTQFDGSPIGSIPAAIKRAWQLLEGDGTQIDLTRDGQRLTLDVAIY